MHTKAIFVAEFIFALSDDVSYCSYFRVWSLLKFFDSLLPINWGEAWLLTSWDDFVVDWRLTKR